MLATATFRLFAMTSIFCVGAAGGALPFTVSLEPFRAGLSGSGKQFGAMLEQRGPALNRSNL